MNQGINVRRLTHEKTGEYVRVHQSAAEHDAECAHVQWPVTLDGRVIAHVSAVDLKGAEAAFCMSGTGWYDKGAVLGDQDTSVGEKRYHYRVTRPLAYPANTPGHQDPAARQGHYTHACCATKAADTIRVRLTGVLTNMSELDVQVWP